MMQQPDETEDKEDKEEIDDELEDEEFDEDFDDCPERRSRVGGVGGITGRGCTLQMLLSEGILQPGDGAMSIEYLGQKFIGDLLPSGKIKSQETNQIFGSPSAWAIHCKKIVNPDKKSGCGWASVKYRGKKLDAYKNSWFKKKRQDQNKENEGSEDEEMEPEKPLTPAPRIVVKHNVLGSRQMNHDVNTLVESTPFSAMGKIQPFMVSMATNAVLVMDFHCHLTTSEVVGYLAGHWDVNAHNLAITHAFPCRSRLGDKELASCVEMDIQRAIEQRRLTLVGWYHSHPFTAATPTLRDIDAQMDYQIKMKGNSDASYTPCVGVICSPYNQDCPSLESSIISYWVMPPPESKPHEYGKPMLMNYSVVQDQFLSQDSLNEMKKCAEFYKGERDFVKFLDKYKGDVTYLDKLKRTLTSKFPRDQSDGILWAFIRDLVCSLGFDGKSDFDDTTASSDRNSVVNDFVKFGTSISDATCTGDDTRMTSAWEGEQASTKSTKPEISISIITDSTPKSSDPLPALSKKPVDKKPSSEGMFVSPLGLNFDQVSIFKLNGNPAPSTSKFTGISPDISVTKDIVPEISVTTESQDKPKTTESST